MKRPIVLTLLGFSLIGVGAQVVVWALPALQKWKPEQPDAIWSLQGHGLLLLWAFTNIAVGIGLLLLKRWARNAVLVVSCLWTFVAIGKASFMYGHLGWVILGFGLTGFTFWYFSRASVCILFKEGKL